MKLSLFDAFAKAKGDYVLSRTSSGAIITLTSVVVALALALSEFSYYQQIVTENHVKIDTRPGERNLTIALDISFFHLACQGMPRNFAIFSSMCATHHLQRLGWLSKTARETDIHMKLTTCGTLTGFIRRVAPTM